jgi:hypothetical protein
MTPPEEDQTPQAGLPDAAYKSLRVAVQIRRSRGQLRRLHSSIANHLQELSGELWIAVVNQVVCSQNQDLLQNQTIADANRTFARAVTAGGRLK